MIGYFFAGIAHRPYFHKSKRCSPQDDPKSPEFFLVILYRCMYNSCKDFLIVCVCIGSPARQPGFLFFALLISNKSFNFLSAEKFFQR